MLYLFLKGSFSVNDDVCIILTEIEIISLKLEFSHLFF